MDDNNYKGGIVKSRKREKKKARAMVQLIQQSKVSEGMTIEK